MKKFLAGLCLLFVATSANAFDFKRHSGCTDDQGRLTKTVIKSEPLTGSAYMDVYHGPVIAIDGITARTYSAEVIDFVYLHECAHHKLGHVKRPVPFFTSTNTNREIAADCWARDEYIKRHGKESFDAMLEEALPLNGEWRNNRIKANCL